jgi:hypothetical protein
VPELARLTYHRDARVRSAADVALLSLMSSHKDVSGTIEVLLECIRYFTDFTFDVENLLKARCTSTTDAVCSDVSS